MNDMIFELNSLVPLVTILGAASAPTIAAIWAEGRRKRDARDAATKVSDVKNTLMETAKESNVKLDEIQLSQAVDRLTAATNEIEELKRLVRELQKAVPAKPRFPLMG
jgi:hypothetical protein